ncbi:MAG: hypothetical protein ACLGHC_09345, partial [Alphaproteobacteria bacterium]
GGGADNTADAGYTAAMSTKARAVSIRIAGLLIMALAAGAVLLPIAQHIPGRTVVGLMLIAAGLIELAAVAARSHGHRLGQGLAAVASVVAGLRLVLDPNANFFTVLNLVVLWLVIRAGALFVSGLKSRAPLCNWAYFAAAVDFLMAVVLLGGLPVAVLVYGLFGQTGEIVATFAWILAASFVATGLLLVASASLQARERN